MIMKYIPVIVIFLFSQILFAETDVQTFYTEDRYFVTAGEIRLKQPAEAVGLTLLKYNEYSDWALNGMQGIDKESEGLIAYFTEIVYSADTGLFLITFDINLIWPFGRKGNVMQFRPYQKYSPNGALESITLVPLLGYELIEDAELIFNLNDTVYGSSINFESRIRLSKFLDFFFSLRAYKRNFEWYVYKVADNLSEYLTDD